MRGRREKKGSEEREIRGDNREMKRNNNERDEAKEKDDNLHR